MHLAASSERLCYVERKSTHHTGPGFDVNFCLFLGAWPWAIYLLSPALQDRQEGPVQSYILGASCSLQLVVWGSVTYKVVIRMLLIEVPGTMLDFEYKELESSRAGASV